MKKISILLTLLVALVGCSSRDAVSLRSPRGNNTILFELREGVPHYSLLRHKETIIKPSSLGLILDKGDMSRDYQIDRVERRSINDDWVQLWGEDSLVENRCNEMVVTLRQHTNPSRQMQLIFRAYDEGIAFRYHLPAQDDIDEVVILDEVSQYRLPAGSEAWYIAHDTPTYEGLYRKAPIPEIDTVATPLTVELSSGGYLALHEANLTEYASLNLAADSEGTLTSYLTPWQSGEKVFTQAPFYSPWRTIVTADCAGDLLLSRMMLSLNEPQKIADAEEWIRPGRYIGIWWSIHLEHNTWHDSPRKGATTQNTMRYIDFAAKHGFSGVLAEGWNEGWEDWRFDFCTPSPMFDLKRVTDYAAERGVEFIGHHETGGDVEKYESQMEEAFALLQQHGVNIVKTGYVGNRFHNGELHGSQYGVRHYRKVVETAARYRIMIDCHEPVMPTGLQRTYPNLMTQEGVRGQEWDAWSKDGGNPPSHTTILPFTRGLAGPMDFTPGTFCFDNPKYPATRVRTTVAKQLALSVVLYSPLQMASDMIESYANRPEFDFITSCPTTWAESIVPSAEIGSHVTIARRERGSDRWFVGAITAEEPRTEQLALSFLESDKLYKATIFADGVGAHYNDNPYPVVIHTEEVTLSDTLTLNLAAGGGCAIRIEPQTK